MEKQLIPQLRFPEFEGEWRLRKYNKIYSFYTTNSLSRDKLNYEEGIVKNIHYGDIHTKFSTLFDIEKEKVPFVNSDVDLTKIKDENFCQEGDLLIADASEDYNDIGKTTEIVNLDSQRLISGLHTFHARPNKYKMAVGFSGYLLQSWKVRKQVMTIAQGTKVLSLATSRLGDINLIIASLPEQQKIASFLTDVDAKITQLIKKKELLEHYKKGVMQKIFNQELRFKDDNGNAFANWEEKKLGTLVKKAQSGGTPKSTNKSYYDGNIPFLSISDMTTQGKYLKYTSKSISQLGIDNSSSWIVPINSIIYSMYASVGFVSINKIDLATSQAVMNIILKDNINIEYIYYYLVDFKQHIHRMIETGTQGNINASIVKGIKIDLPCQKEQTKIANFLSDIDVKIEALNTKIENSKVFKKGLLQQMFV